MINRIIRYSQATVKTIPSAKTYVDRFTSLQMKLKQQSKRIQQLQKQSQLAQCAKQMTIADHLKKMMSSLTGSPFESKAMRQLKQELIWHRNELENKIQESDTKWEKPRQEIIKLRKQMANEFLSKFVQLQQNLLKTCTLKDTSPDLVEGFNLIHRLLLSTLQKHGVTFFEPKVGQQFQPEAHDTADKEEKGKNIKQVISRGWKIQQKIVKKPIVRLM